MSVADKTWIYRRARRKGQKRYWGKIGEGEDSKKKEEVKEYRQRQRGNKRGGDSCREEGHEGTQEGGRAGLFKKKKLREGPELYHI